jgi:DNA-binding beta-propeller fold protein YncE
MQGTHKLLSRLGVAAAVAVFAAGLPLSHAPAAADPPVYSSTLVGPSLAAMYPSGLEHDTANNRLVIADTGLDRVLFYSLSGTKLGEFGTPGSSDGQFLSPRDIAVDGAGNIYVADAENNRVQKFTSTGVWQWTRGGTGNPDTCQQCLNTPIGVTWDTANNVLLVASTGQNRIRAFDTNGNTVWTSPPGTALGIDAPRDVQRDPAGRLWITDYRNHQMKAYSVDAAGVFASNTPTLTLGGNGSGLGQLNFPYNAVWSADGNTMYVSDTGNGRVARWSLTGGTPTPLPAFGRKCPEHPDPCPDPPAAQGQFNHLRRVARDSAGNIYAADFWGNGIEVFSPTGSVVRQIEGATAPVPGVAEAFGVAVGPDGTTYVMDRLNQRLQRFSAAGTFLNHAGSRGTAGNSFSWPEAVAVAPDGSVWAADTRGDRISKWPADLNDDRPIPTWGSTGSGVGQFNYVEDLDVAPDGRVFIADTRNNRIQIFNPATTTFSAFGIQGSGNGQFARPQGVAVSTDAVYVADTDNNRIQKLSLSGAWQATYSTGLNGPQGVAVAPDGSVWVADTANNRVLHLDADLVPIPADTFGTGGTGPGQFDRPHTLHATATKLYVADTYNNRVQVFTIGSASAGPFAPTYASEISNPGGVAALYPAGGVADTAGNRYIADSGGSRIVKIDPAGIQTTVLASGLNDPRKVVFDSAGTDLWVADTSDSQVLRVTTSGTVVSTFGGTSVFRTPYGLDNDSTGVYVADTYNNRVRKINKATGAVIWTQTTCSGQTLSRPRDLTVGSDGNVYVADTDRNRIAVLNPSTGACITAFGSGGSGNNQFQGPRGITSDGAGGLWVAEAWNYRAKHVQNNGTYIAKTNSTQGQGTNQFAAAQCVFVQGNILNVCDTYNYRINRYTVDGAGVPTFLDTIGAAPAAPGGFNGPFGVDYGPSGELYVTDWFNHRIQKFNPDGTFALQWGMYGFTNGALIFPRDIDVAPNGEIVVTDSENNRIDVFTSNGTFVRKIQASAPAFSRPHQTAVAPDGSYWIADTLNNRLVRTSSTGTLLGTAAGLSGPEGVAVDAAGNVYVSNTGQNRVEKRTPTGAFAATLTTGVSAPAGLEVVTHGGTDILLVADKGNHRVVAVGTDGTPVTNFGTAGGGAGQLQTPRGVAVDPTDGQIAVADWANNRVSVWTSTGGGGTPGPDTTPPDATVTVPTNGQAFAPGAVNMSGTATDNVGVAAVEIAIKNSATGQWWKGSSWGTGATYFAATLGTPGATSTSWAYSWTPPAAGSYGISVRAKDGAGNVDPTKPWVTFTTTSGDTAPPDGTISSPTANQAFPNGPVGFAGNATDDSGVGRVRIAVKNRTTNQWWNGTAWQASFTYFADATLALPGATSTGWAYTWVPPALGSYQVMAGAFDTSNNVDPTKPVVNFSVT